METQYRVVRNKEQNFTVQFLVSGSTTWLPVAGRSTFILSTDAVKLKNMLEDEEMKLKHRGIIEEIIDPPRQEKKRKIKKDK